jgi:hypothetical protein
LLLIFITRSLLADKQIWRLVIGAQIPTTHKMDFINLANTAHETSRYLFRVLTESATGEDDDFAHLENVDHTGAAGSTIGGADGMGTTAGGADLNRPLLSPTAEAALLELSTNFLLCK